MLRTGRLTLAMPRQTQTTMTDVLIGTKKLKECIQIANPCMQLLILCLINTDRSTEIFYQIKTPITNP